VDKRRPEEKETARWLSVMAHVRSVLVSLAPETKPWFQLDRGGDAWPVLLQGIEPGQLFTVRASRNRRLWSDADEPRRYLWEELERALVLGHYNFAVPGGPARSAREARMEVRSADVTFCLQKYPTKQHVPATLYAVLVREVSTVPAGEAPLEWMLLTTYEVHDLADAQTVVRGYAQRWRIEEFHRIWKTGLCNVEDTQLGDRDNIIRWAIILASVAARILRISYLGRNQPELAAAEEFEREEIDAVIILRKPVGCRRGSMPTIGQLVRWLADLGGYTGELSGGPPGAIVIGRGLQRIQPVVELLKGGEL
jgi:hypothetical protein